MPFRELSNSNHTLLKLLPNNPEAWGMDSYTFRTEKSFDVAYFTGGNTSACFRRQYSPISAIFQTAIIYVWLTHDLQNSQHLLSLSAAFKQKKSHSIWFSNCKVRDKYLCFIFTCTIRTSEILILAGPLDNLLLNVKWGGFCQDGRIVRWGFGYV